MPLVRSPRLAAFLALTALACGDPPPPPEPLHTGPSDPELEPERPLSWADIAADTVAWNVILAAEDRRASRPGDLEALREAGTSPHPGIRRAAVRALGRLERPERVGDIAPFLDDPDPAVRAEAANALAQAARPGGADAARGAREILLGRASAGEDPTVLAALARGIGRLPVADADVLAGVEGALLGLSRLSTDPSGVEADAPPTVLLGIARGALFLYRSAAAARLAAGSELPARLDLWSLPPHPSALRRTAVAARVAAGPPDPSHLARLMEDPDPGVRRVAASALPLLPPDSPRGELVARALADPESEVRIEGVRAWHRALRSAGGCAPLMAATEDPVDGVALAALDALAEPCPPEEPTAELLRALAAALPEAEDGAWHRASRALHALARTAPREAAPLLPSFAGHGNPFVRAHAARSAAELGDTGTLRRLAADPDPNVREASIRGLSRLEGRGADSLLVAQLELDDPQLLQTTARLLEGSRQGGPAVPALFRALGRLTNLEASTTRDARVALLRRIGELGTFWQAAQVEPYLEDFDPVVAAEAARILTEWTEEPQTPRPRGHTPLPLPTVDELRRLETTPAEIVLASGDLLRLRLLPFEAPTNAARFARMAEAGRFDGLTLHRVAPNFVLQGGSPGANEYAGHGAYTRDELGLLGHWRGTLGISTRGRDTGDGQIFINLVDNLRLDHDYTVFAELVDGLEALERIQEGAVLRQVRLVVDPDP